MSLIVFDLEWNIGYQPRLFDYHGAEQTLRGEIIQIGAVKVDETGRVLDTFSLNLKPRLFRKLQHHIAKVTGMTQADLDGGVPIREGLQRFVRWCGPDAAFAEWGMDDVPVLKQNLFLNNLDERWPTRWYDLQQIFLAQRGRAEGEGMTLESVITRLGIPTDRPFHDALSDALYTVDVCQRLDLARGIAEYPTEEQQLRGGARPGGERLPERGVLLRLPGEGGLAGGPHLARPALPGLRRPAGPGEAPRRPERGRAVDAPRQQQLLRSGSLRLRQAVVCPLQNGPAGWAALGLRPLL